MGSGLTSLIFSIGFSGWVYYQILNKTGGNTKTAMKATIGAGLSVFVVLYLLLKFTLNF